MDESGDQFVAYFLPTAETITKRKRDAEVAVDYEPEEEYVGFSIIIFQSISKKSRASFSTI